MCTQLLADRHTQVVQVHSRTFAPRKFEGWYKIAIARDHHYHLGTLLQRDSSDIKTDSQIDAFLLHVWNQVLSLGRGGRFKKTL